MLSDGISHSKSQGSCQRPIEEYTADQEFHPGRANIPKRILNVPYHYVSVRFKRIVEGLLDRQMP